MSIKPTTEQTIHPVPILVELAQPPGVYQVSLPTPEELAELSAQSLESAMETIAAMALRASVMIDNLAGNPDKVELKFGLKLYAEGNAMIAKGGAEAAIAVTLIWKRGDN
jgi:hypothetical protein